MPVITRTQIKKMTAVKPVSQPVTRVEQKLPTPTISSVWHSEDELAFASDLKRLIGDCDLAPGKTAKMQVALQIFNRVNNNLEKLLAGNTMKWLKFAATVYNKATEFEDQRDTYKEVDSRLVDLFTESYRKARKFLSNYFKNLRTSRPGLTNLTESPFAEMYKNIDLCDFEAAKVSRPRRNVPVVDYTGMDTVEPWCEYDGITNIWADETIDYDSDYVPEDDCEEEDDDDDEEFLRTRPFVTVRSKKTVEKDLDPYDVRRQIYEKSLIQFNSRPQRNIRKVDYSGMDMTEEDDGSVYVCETKWKNRVPTHR